MTGASKTVFELIANPGTNPIEQVDTDELDPPIYENIAQRGTTQLTIEPADDDVEVEIPDSCYLLILSDEPVLVRLAAAEMQLRLRKLEIGAEDSEHTAIAATTLLISGNGSNAAEVTIRYLATVT